MSVQAIATATSNYLFLGMVVGIPFFAQLRKVPVYDSFIKGAKGGIDITVRIIPFLVGMLVAIGMFRASGAVDLIAQWLSPFFSAIGLPTDTLPLILIRPFSGSAANGVLADIVKTHGGDAFVSHLAATMMGSTETTFYVIAVYFGAANIKRTRHAIPAGLLADLAGIVAALIVCHALL